MAATELAGTWVFNDRLFGGNLELLDIQFILNFDSNGYHLTGLALSQSNRPDNEIAFMYFDDVGRVYFGDQFDEEDTTSDRWGHENFKTITITSKLSEVTNGDTLLAWLQANATKQETDTSKKLTKLKYKVSNVCQFIKPNLFYNTTSAGLTITSNGDTFTVNGTSTEKTSIGTDIKNWTPVIGHKILVSGCPEGGGANTFGLGAFNQTGAIDYGNGAIGSVITTGNWFGIVFESGVTFNNLIFKPQLFDLTEMYGAGNEPTTVEQFRQKYPNELYPYSPYCWAKLKSLIYKDDIEYIKMKEWRIKNGRI